jgi:hypothetical protein
VREVALPEEPLEVAIGCGPDVARSERGLFATVAHGISFVALRTMIAIEDCAGCRAIGTGSERICPNMILLWNAVPVGMDCGAEQQAGAKTEKKNSE